MPRKIIYHFLCLCFFVLVWGEECKDTENFYFVNSRKNKNDLLYSCKEKLFRGNEVIELDVNVYQRGKDVVFTKKGKNIKIDSTVFSNGTIAVDEQYRIDEKHTLNRYKLPNSSGETNFLIFDNDGRKIQWFIIGIKREELYDNTGKLLPLFKEIHGDTVFCNLEYEDDGVFY